MNVKMNILHWPSSYPDASNGQSYHAIFIEEHIKSINNFVKNRVIYISPEPCKSNRWHEKTTKIENQIKVTRFYFSDSLPLKFLNLYIRLQLFLFMLKLIFVEKFKPDIIHVHFFPAGEWAKIYAKMFQCKMVVTEHWTALIGYPIISSSRFIKAKQVYEFADALLPVSHHLLKGILSNTKADVMLKSTVIHNCVNTDIFKLDPILTQRISRYHLVSVARMDEQKDIPTMLKAFKLIKSTHDEAKLTIIGGGDKQPYLKMAEEIGIADAVDLIGIQTKSEIAAMMNKANLFVLSSISENSPCVIGEAQCCGLPVVATDVGGVKELIIEGAVVPPKSPELLAQKVIEQLNSPIDRHLLATKAQARFSYDAIGQQIFEVYQNVCVE